jgi:hypothetical protein
MQSAALTDPVPAARRWTGRIVFAVVVLFLVFDIVGKLLAVPPVVEGTIQLGYPGNLVRVIGLILLACLVVYVIPRTSVLGAVLLTGYLGGAVATQVRVGSPVFTHILFPVYVAVLTWGALYFRDGRVRALIAKQ